MNELNHGNGKGSADRTTDRQAFLANLDEVQFPGVSGGERTARGWRKVYSAAAPANFPLEDLEWPGGEFPRYAVDKIFTADDTAA